MRGLCLNCKRKENEDEGAEDARGCELARYCRRANTTREIDLGPFLLRDTSKSPARMTTRHMDRTDLPSCWSEFADTHPTPPIIKTNYLNSSRAVYSNVKESEHVKKVCGQEVNPNLLDGIYSFLPHFGEHTGTADADQYAHNNTAAGAGLIR